MNYVSGFLDMGCEIQGHDENHNDIIHVLVYFDISCFNPVIQINT